MTHIYMVEGFGIPGDKAMVEASTVLEAKQAVAAALKTEEYDSETSQDKWEVKLLRRPLSVLFWWRD